jgi:regulator of nonsense transcripts 1
MAMNEGAEIEYSDIEGGQSVTRAPRILAVTHSNGAADVLLQALLQMNVPAVRAGRPASVSPLVQHRTIAALAARMPHVVRLRQQAGNVTLDEQTRRSAVYDAQGCMNDAQRMIIESASVVVTSCIGAQQLLSTIEDETKETNGTTLKLPMFPIVVLDEAGQTTEPALISALVAAQADQVIMVGDTRQLPPTCTSQDAELRMTLGVSPMERLLNNGIDEFVLKEQYRMPSSLLYYPNKYFYDSVVRCATKNALPPPKGFPWPSPNAEPLAFLEVGNGCNEVTHDLGGGKSNPTEVRVIVDIIVEVIAAGEILSNNIAIITPYSKQVQLFRTELSNAVSTRSTVNGKCKISDVQVGTVDSFQGQETDLVIFSAVRSNLLKEMGFLRDERRLNVAITRARRGLIVVGDPTVLRTCRHWEALLDSCKERKCVLTLTEYLTHAEEMMATVMKESLNGRSTRSIPLEFDADDNLCGLFDN